MARKKEPWWAGGLTFRCTACGQCCTGEPGHVWVDRDEIRRMAQHLGESERAFIKRTVRKVGRRLSLKERKNGDCVMLVDGKCSVYGAKPERCTTYPFWKPVLASPEMWDDNAERCEGIGQGDYYSREEIETLLTGDTTPLETKHARPPESPVITHYDVRGERIEEPRPLESGATTDADGPAKIDWEAAFKDLQRLYDELDRELPAWEFTCSASGNCCDFDAFGHRLYVTTLEYAWFHAGTAGRRVNEDDAMCPAWGSDRLCKAREVRMLGCRTYHCGPYPKGGPETIHEKYMARMKRLHDRYGIPYEYKDVRVFAAGGDPRASAAHQG